MGYDMNRFGLYAMVLLCAALAASSFQCETNTAAELNAQEQKTAESKAENPENVILVETVKLQPRTMHSYILLNAPVETEQMVDVYPKATGIITAVNVEEGNIVRHNSVLLQLEDHVQQLAEQKAHVVFKKKEADFQRVRESFEKKIISKVDYDNAQYELQEAEINWKQAQLDFGYTRVTSPINGIVAERLVRTGDRVQPSTKLFHIVDTSEKIVRVYIPEKDISAVQAGQEALLVSEFLDDGQFQGTIKRISPVVDPNSGTFKVTIGISDPQNALRPGMFTSVRIITAVHENVIAVPKDALVYDSGMPFVFVVKNDAAHKIPLKQGFSDERYVESLEGLSAGDRIIIVGQSGLKDGSAVKDIAAGGMR